MKDTLPEVIIHHNSKPLWYNTTRHAGDAWQNFELHTGSNPVLFSFRFYGRLSLMEKNEYLDLYYQMVLIRTIEEEAAQLYQQGKIGGFLHLYIGQEAVSTGLISARPPQDP